MVTVSLSKFNMVPTPLFPVVKFSESQQSFDWQSLERFHSEAGPLVLQGTLGREVLASEVWNLHITLEFFFFFNSQILQVQLIFNFILIELFQWCLKGHIKYMNTLTNERKYSQDLKIFWIIFSFFLAVSVMRYSASAFGFAVSNLKCTFMKFCTFLPGPQISRWGLWFKRVVSRWEREHNKHTFYGSRFYKQL